MKVRKQSVLISQRFLKFLLVAFWLVGLCSTCAFADSICSTCNGTGQRSCAICLGAGHSYSNCVVCGGAGGTYQSQMVPQTTYSYGFGGIMTPTTTYTTQSVRVSCTSCGGSGKTFTNCTSCGGSGKTYCTSCGGTGRISSTSTSSSGSTGSSSSGGTSSTGDTADVSSSASSSSSSSTESSETTFQGGCVVEALGGTSKKTESTNLFDNNTKTSYVVSGDYFYVIWKAPASIKVSSYTMTTSADASKNKGCLPKSWYLFGSKKKISFEGDSLDKCELLDEVKNDKTIKNKNSTAYTFKLKKTSKKYRYFLLKCYANKGGDTTQLSSLSLTGVSPSLAVSRITSVKKDGNSSIIKWKKAAKITGYQIQYSTSADFKTKKSFTVKKASVIKKTVKLKKGKTYYMRIRTWKQAKGAKLFSAWSKKKSFKIS